MIPLKDLTPRTTPPVVTVLIIIANVLVFLYQLSLGPRAERELVFMYGMIPARVPLAFTHSSVTLSQAFEPLLTSMFLHGGWLHLIGNMWFLWVFGGNVEDALGHFQYLMFYLICGIAAGVVHTFVNLGSTAPAVGASGAISGVMGAYVVLFPSSRVLTLVPLLFLFFTVRLPALLFLGYWFVLQFLSGVSSLDERTVGGTAWWAHVGGFLVGALLVIELRHRVRRRWTT